MTQDTGHIIHGQGAGTIWEQSAIWDNDHDHTYDSAVCYAVAV